MGSVAVQKRGQEGQKYPHECRDKTAAMRMQMRRLTGAQPGGTMEKAGGCLGNTPGVMRGMGRLETTLWPPILDYQGKF
jgi:hypothetical protein